MFWKMGSAIPPPFHHPGWVNYEEVNCEGKLWRANYEGVTQKNLLNLLLRANAGMFHTMESTTTISLTKLELCSIAAQNTKVHISKQWNNVWIGPDKPNCRGIDAISTGTDSYDGRHWINVFSGLHSWRTSRFSKVFVAGKSQPWRWTSWSPDVCTCLWGNILTKLLQLCTET